MACPDLALGSFHSVAANKKRRLNRKNNMPETHFKVEVESEHIRKLTAAKPIVALAELVWNACDADATRIDIEIDRNELGMDSIAVRDNGPGIAHGDIERLFGRR